jgi:Zn ribbon nucleic-acid-binding protein
MATVLRFMMGSEGDPSVGISGFENSVTIIFPDDRQHNYKDKDTIEFFTGVLADFADGWCVTQEEWDKARTKEKMIEAIAGGCCPECKSTISPHVVEDNGRQVTFECNACCYRWNALRIDEETLAK